MKFRFPTRLVNICLLGAGVTVLHIQLQLYFSLNHHHDDISPISLAKNNEPATASRLGMTTTSSSSSTADCCINLYGLPRAFESIVLPSFKKNVIAVNPNCDYFVHAYNLTEEVGGRSGAGGFVDAEDILLLEDAVHQVNPKARVEFTWDQEADFWQRYKDLIEKIHTVPDRTDPTKRRYYPNKAKSYRFPMTVDNILKMWHSIESVWRLMMQFNQNKQYIRVAMLRSDVCYLTPIDIWSNGKGQRDVDNKVVVMPGFGRFPVSDRIIYGPAQAVEPWAIHRFDKIDDHASYMEQNHPGWTMHSERFVRFTVLPQIPPTFEIVEHSTMCFVRARADESLWMTDCFIGKPFADIALHLYNFTSRREAIPPQHRPIIRATVESVLGRTCVPGTWSKLAKYGPHLALDCRRL